jgi:hypothetical protein
MHFVFVYEFCAKETDIMIVLSSHCVLSSRDHVDGKKRTIPVCFSRENLTLLEKYAKKKGMQTIARLYKAPQLKIFSHV